MKIIHSLFVLNTVIAAVQLSLAQSIPVSPDSEMGQMMREMDRKARAFQNAAIFTRELERYQKKTRLSCDQIEFSALEEPAESVVGKDAIHVMRAKCSEGDAILRFRVRIRFKDAAMTVAHSIKIMERLPDVDDEGE